MTRVKVLLAIAGALVAAIAVMGDLAPPPREDAAYAAELAGLRLERLTWRRAGFGNVAVASFDVINGGALAVRDLALACAFAGSSGTVIGTARPTLYRRLMPGDLLRVRDFSLGLIDPQAADLSCRVAAYR